VATGERIKASLPAASGADVTKTVCSWDKSCVIGDPGRWIAAQNRERLEFLVDQLHFQNAVWTSSPSAACRATIAGFTAYPPSLIIISTLVRSFKSGRASAKVARTHVGADLTLWL